MQVSIIVRTLNEGRYLGGLLAEIAAQRTDGLAVEVVIVDSGSTDETLSIAWRQECVVESIAREEFSFGRSLNRGCAVARGEILVMISGHCAPMDDDWLQRLCQPILDGQAAYVYGRQLGGPESRFSECRIFAKYYPKQSCIPQEGFFCNNANAALARASWKKHPFDETLTGLEDMELAQRLVQDGEQVAYVAEAGVFHYHHETWAQIERRFEREAIALQKIMPQIHLRRRDVIRYVATSILKDWYCAWRAGVWLARAREIVCYRWSQYRGCYKGNHEHRKLSHVEKEKYFYPD